MYVKAFVDGKEEIESLQDRITGRFACETICDKDGNVLVKANHMITPKRAASIIAKGVDESGNPIEGVKIRTVLTCRSHVGIRLFRLVKLLVLLQHSLSVSRVHS